MLDVLGVEEARDGVLLVVLCPVDGAQRGFWGRAPAAETQLVFELTVPAGPACPFLRDPEQVAENLRAPAQRAAFWFQLAPFSYGG